MVTTPKMEQLSSIRRKRKGKLLSELEEKESEKVSFPNIPDKVSQRTLSTITARRSRAVEVQEMYLLEPGNWPSIIPENTGTILLKRLYLKVVKLSSIMKQHAHEVWMLQQKHLKPW